VTALKAVRICWSLFVMPHNEIVYEKFIYGLIKTKQNE
jgi:hypothetical protein